jgi:DNA-binding GntR family transcriptional regulator
MYTDFMEKKRSDSIARDLEGMILDGTFADGQRLDEVQLAQRFRVSRTPLREALQRLALAGLVEQIPRRGVFVRQPGPVELVEMFEVMAELEAACARLAASRITDVALDALQQANANCQRAVEAQDADGFYRENETFHAILYAQSGNSILEQECKRLHRRLSPFRRRQLRLRGRLRQSMAEHEAVVEAIRRGDGEAAAATIRAHVAVQGEKFHALIASLKPAAE